MAGPSGFPSFGSAALGGATLALLALPASAYVGPGASLGVLGTALAIVAAVVLALLAIVWYPLKALIRRRRGRKPEPTDGGGD